MALPMVLLAACAPTLPDDPAPHAQTDVIGLTDVSNPPDEQHPAPSVTSAPPTTVPAADEPHRVVDATLLSYDRALTDLAVDPTALGAAGTQERLAWDLAVVPGSGFSGDMLDMLRRRQSEDGVVVLPGPGGLAYLHRSLLVEPPLHGAVSFTWCGYSPGIGVDATTGEVVDDQVGHAHGTGQLRWTDAGWQVEALDQFDLAVLAPGSDDPCVAEVEALQR